MPEHRTVRVIDRSTWGTRGPYPNIVSVSLHWQCPQCDGPRGEPKEYYFWENDAGHTVDRWNNECGHIDKYDDCLAEAKRNKKGA